MQSFSRIVSTIWCWWHGEIGLTPGLTNWGEARGEGQGLNGFCCRIIIKHPHFRNTSLARCRLLPWKHKRSDLDTCFSIFKAFKPFHKPREWVKLGCKNIWFQTNPFVSCQNFTILKQPIFPMFLSMAQQRAAVAASDSDWRDVVRISPPLPSSLTPLTTPTCKSSSKLHPMRM